MDIKLKKSHRLTTCIILLCVLIPALVLVGLYPKMEKTMLEKRTAYQQQVEELRDELGNPIVYEVCDKFINYAMEASYYIYGQLLEELRGSQVDFSVLHQYEWISNYYKVYENAGMKAILVSEDGIQTAEMEHGIQTEGTFGILEFHFDQYGNLDQITQENIEIWFQRSYASVYEAAMGSETQYKNNVKLYNMEQNGTVSAEELRPKNFTITFTIDENSQFVSSIYEDLLSYGTEDVERLYLETGAYWIAVALALAVVILALLLPFIKPLRTGEEKIFSGPFEVTCILGIGALGFGIFMCLFMSHTTMWGLKQFFANHYLPEILGYIIKIRDLYRGLLVLNAILWTIEFFLIYVVASNLRQIFSNTKFYFKNQILCVRFFRWLKRKGKEFYRYITDIQMNEKMHKSIWKIVIANFLVLTILCSFWFFGVIGLVLYSIALYILLCKEGEKIQRQYDSILKAAKQMADGDLEISLEEDLGIFATIGSSLEEVQQGFEKAVVEEAKSQSMKTELITNVSHDLKTPLTAIITYVDLLKKENISEEERESYIATLDQKSQRLKVLIEDLFEVSKAQSGNVKMNFMDVDVVGLLKQVRSEMNEQIESSNLQFRWDLPADKIILSLDGQRTYRVFENLLNNILKYAMPNSRVYIDVSETDTEVQIQFRNISAMELDFDVQRLTERFVRGDSSRNSDGSGLGLAIAKSFVELQHGSFCVEVDGDLFKVIAKFSK